MTDYLLAQVHLPQFDLAKDNPPGLEAAALRLGVAVSSLDPEYGVVSIDAEAGLYAVRLESAAAPRVQGTHRDGGPDGIYSDVRIEPMGPRE